MRAHGEARLVATLSFGAPRRFGLRRRRAHGGGGVGGEEGGEAGGEVGGEVGGEAGGGAEAEAEAEGEYLREEYLELEAGSVLGMWGRTQEAFEHELPLRPGDGHRISLTFRSIVPGFEDGVGAAADDACVANI